MSVHATISVVIPCYNRARYLREAVDSALAQTLAPLEIIAVDDGSTDETPAILASYGGRIQVVAQANAGLAAARNAGIAAARGDRIALLDSDDAWEPDKLARQIAAAERWPEAALIHTRCLVIDEQSRPVPPEKPPTEHVDRLEPDALERLLIYCYPNASSCLIRRESLLAVGGFDPSWRSAEEWDFCLRLAERHPFAYVGAPLTRYRVHAQSLTANRLAHTLGLVRLRQTIEARKPGWLAERDSPALRRALRRHTHEFAHIYSRLGLLYQRQGAAARARDAFRAAARLEPLVLKHRLRALRLSLVASLWSTRPDEKAV